MSDLELRQLRERVIHLCPALNADDVDRLTGVTLHALAEQLASDELKRLEHELPAPFAAALHKQRLTERASPTLFTPPSKEALFQSVAASERVDLGVAIEHTELICRALAELLPSELIQMLRKHLPPLSELFEIPAPFGAPLPHVHGDEGYEDLARGRPGSHHPLSNANPESLAHEHSIARSDDPRAERKLSSSHLPTKEREDETLATGRAGARRRLADGH